MKRLWYQFSRWFLFLFNTKVEIGDIGINYPKYYSNYISPYSVWSVKVTDVTEYSIYYEFINTGVKAHSDKDFFLQKYYVIKTAA